MKRLVILFFALFAITTASFAQKGYNQAVGVRGGLVQGITAKKFIGDKTALEGILFTRWRGAGITGLYELHSWNAFDVDNLNWFYGLGATVGFYDGYYYSGTGSNFFGIGIDGIVGLEYNFEEIPINISVDIKPSFNLLGYDDYLGYGGAFSIRYLFDR